MTRSEEGTGRRLLFVTPYFPPAAGSGVQRGAKFVKYLLRIGWTVRIVTIDPATVVDHDPTAVPEIAAATVEPVALRTLPFVDHRVLRALPEMRKCIRGAIQEFSPTIAFTTAPDYHWPLVERITRKFRVPLVLDYPDPWTVLPPDFLAYRPPTAFKSRLKWALAPALERRCLRGSAASVFATTPIFDEYAARFPSVARTGQVITNGFDSDDFEGAPETRPAADGVRVVHVGSFGGPRTPLAAALAVRMAADERPDLRWSLRLAGAGAEPFAGSLRDILRDIPFELTGWLDHHAAVREICSASILWLDAISHLRSASTGKIFEYLYSGRPIVAVAHPDGPAAGLVRTFDAGEVVSTNDHKAAGDALVGVAVRLNLIPPGRRSDSRLEAYERRALAGELSSLFDRVSHPLSH